MIMLWQGSANQWDCDEMGHMNVRVYIEKAIEGLGVFAQAIQMPHAFKPNSVSTLIVADQHIRYIREVHPGRPLTMTGCVLEIGESDCFLYQEMRHADGTPAAAFRTKLIHARAKTGNAFPWSTRTRTALEELKGKPPKDTAPRSIEPDSEIRPAAEVTRDIARAHNATLIGMGTVPDNHCDLHGRMRTSWFMGRMSDSVPNLLYQWRTEVTKAAGATRTGGAVLEYRLAYRAYPRAGDTYEIYASYNYATDKVHSLVYWIIDPVSGAAWASTEAIAVAFDLDTRKIIKSQPEQLEILEKMAPTGLSL